MALSADAVHTRSAQAVRRRGERQRLQLQYMERALVGARLARPAVLGRDDYECLRYAIGLARLHVFRPYGLNADVAVDSTLIAPLRDWLLDNLRAPLHDTASGAAAQLKACREAMPEVRCRAAHLRQRLLHVHASDFGAAALDREAGRRALVMVAGGGGGAGFVYVGAFACLKDNGLIPDYIVGNSMGSIQSMLRACRRQVDQEEQLQFGRGLKNRDVFTGGRRRAEFCVPGLLHLHLNALHRRMRIGDPRRPIRLDEMEIPLDLVVAGVRRHPYSRLPEDVRQPPQTGGASMLPLALRIAGRLSRLLRFFNSDLIESVVLGRDRDTRRIHAVDAAGFSAAVPTILQYEPGPSAGTTREILAELMHRRDLSALVDGGVADNVPMRTAWQGVAEGRAGTRNAYYLAFDCFQPRTDIKNIWLWPIMQSVQMQMRRDRHYADMLIHFDPTLSPLNIVPGGAAFDRSVAWGYEQMQARLPEIREMLRPVSLMQQSAGAAHAS